ncbi:MAG: MarR family transcriptional regulator [Chloroflexi bacterium HGW-Chloroflexi-2]|jgi:MarR family 2-MHQ and catechol resistance regulon transcriptional repressor|nr:MAG: MarR family transcriptional regulator [Chloroflexi bacterium HGW-Chloroflexi-2]
MPTHFQGTPEEELALDTYIKLTRATDTINARLSMASSMQELTISQFGVLEALYHLGPQAQNILGEKILKSNSNMTTVIDNLEKRQLVHRERAKDDRRKIIVHLTDAGLNLIKDIFPKHVRAIEQQFSVLSTEEKQLLCDLLRKLGKQ